MMAAAAPSATERTGVAHRYGSKPCFYFVYIIRAFSAAIGIVECVLSYYGFDALANNRTNELPSNNEIFMGLNLLYLMIIGILTFLAEVRVDFLKRTVLKPFGFLQAFLGRGLFYFFVGTFLVTVDSTYPIIVASLLFFAGFAQILIAVFVFKVRSPSQRPIGEVVTTMNALQTVKSATPVDSTAPGVGGFTPSPDFSGDKQSQPSEANATIPSHNPFLNPV